MLASPFDAVGDDLAFGFGHAAFAFALGASRAGFVLGLLALANRAGHSVSMQ
jgi:hypothetical protein